MADDLFDDTLCDAIASLLEQVDWTPVDGAASDPATPDALYVTHEGVLTIPGVGPLPCYILNTGERVFDVEAMQRWFGCDADDAGVPEG